MVASCPMISERSRLKIGSKVSRKKTSARAFASLLGVALLSCRKSPFTYSHWGRPNAHPESQKILSLHLFGIERSKRNLFFRKKAKIFWKDGLSQKDPLTCSHWQRIFGDSNLEKRQKNLPSNIGGHTFNTKNIIGLLKYSERIHIGWITRQKVL